MAVISWKNPVSGNWRAAADWSTGAVPTSADDVLISAPGSYAVTISSNGVIVRPPPGGLLAALPILNIPDEAKSLTFNALDAQLQENSGSLNIGGALIVGSGLVFLNEANTIGSVSLAAGGVLVFGNGGALGSGTVKLGGGELLANANETLTNDLTFSGSSTIAAADGTTLNETAPTITINANSTLNFGALGQDGIVVWHTSAYGINLPFTFNVVAGTLKAADGGLADMIQFGGQSTTVDAGATLDAGGFGLDFPNLLGGGAIVDSGAADTVTLGAANFSGVISGAQSLVVTGPGSLSGTNTYTGTTTIGSGVGFELGLGGTTGSIGGGAISDGGTLYIDHDNAITLTNAISGSGALRLIGSGVTSINTANTYAGGTILSAGTLAIGSGGALGTGTLSQSGGELFATENETLTNALSLSGSSTIAAAHGKTLNENASSLSIAASSTLNFGAPGEDGTILWHTPQSTNFSSPFPAINVRAGALRGADGSFGFFLDDSSVAVAAGAILDLAGSGTEFTDLSGGGAVTDSGGAATLNLDAANFSGAISGALSLTFEGNASLSGLEDYSGGATLNGATTVTNAGTYDIVGNTNISGSATTSFINNNTFEKTGGGGVSDVTSNFVNDGALNVLSGSVKFSGGFTNNGVIHGRVTQSGGVTTVSALVPSDFNEDGESDILWQNTTSGQGSVWEMNGNTVTGGGPVSPNPGPSFTEVGAGDFNGDGHADILWQNVDGQASIWDMNANTPIGGGPVSPNPGTSWKTVGTGDFNGDGLADILWQNASGQVSIWEMNGNNVIGGGPVSPNPGPSWKAIGTGDFNSDGHSDILFQNTSSGQVSIWEMNGNKLIGGGPVNPNPGPAWQAVGTGDFNDDGHSDILFQNTTSGQASIWEMNGTSLIGGGPVSPNPGTSWKAIRTGDFNGDGHSDILWQNVDGQASIWEMNGTSLIGGGPVSPNPWPSWRAIGV
jgi:autotransporter-associated beta strand protein